MWMVHSATRVRGVRSLSTFRSLLGFFDSNEVILFDFTRQNKSSGANLLDKSELSRTLTADELAEIEERSSFKHWKAVSDQEIGGKSTCTLELSAEEGGKALFKGELSREASTYAEIHRTGFASIFVPMPYFFTSLDDYDAVELILKPDGMKYAFNVKPQSYIPDDLYQGFIMTDSQLEGEWCSAVLPFASFMLTGRGHVKSDQRAFDYTHIDRLGFTISSEQSGPFCLEIKQIKAINLEDRIREMESRPPDLPF